MKNATSGEPRLFRHQCSRQKLHPRSRIIASSRLLTSYEFLSSAITPIELHSAVQRRRRQGEITQPNYNSIVSRLAKDRSYWQLVEVVPQILSKAEELVKTANVRTLDAIHIASAIIIQDSLTTPLPFISADERQRAAAQSCKLSVIAIS